MRDYILPELMPALTQYRWVDLFAGKGDLLLERRRALTDSEFMTTYKYSESAYTRKYLGLSQAKALIETFQYLGLSVGGRERLQRAVRAGNSEATLQVIADNSRGDYALRAPNTHLALGERDFDAVLLEGLVDGEVQVADEFAALVD